MVLLRDNSIGCYEDVQARFGAGHCMPQSTGGAPVLSAPCLAGNSCDTQVSSSCVACLPFLKVFSVSVKSSLTSLSCERRKSGLGPRSLTWLIPSWTKVRLGFPLCHFTGGGVTLFCMTYNTLSLITYRTDSWTNTLCFVAVLACGVERYTSA